MSFTSVCIFHILSEKVFKRRKKEKLVSLEQTHQLYMTKQEILSRIFDLANNNDNNDQKKWGTTRENMTVANSELLLNVNITELRTILQNLHERCIVWLVPWECFLLGLDASIWLQITCALLYMFNIEIK